MRNKKIYQYFKPYQLKATIAVVFKFFEAALELYMPMLLSQVIDNGVLKEDKNYTIKMCFVLIGIIFAGLCCALICQYLASKISQKYGTALRNGLFAHIMSLSHSQKEALTASSMINRIITDATRLQTFVAMMIRLILRAPFLCAGGLIMAFIINPFLAWIVVAALPIFTIITVIIMKKSIPLHKNVQKKLDKVSSVLNENIDGVRVIRAFATEDYENERFQEITNDFSALNMRVKKLSLLLNPITTAIVNLAIVAIIASSGLIVSNNGKISAGDIIALMNYIAQISIALIVVANLIVLLIRAYSSAQRINEIFEISPDINYGNIKKSKLKNEYAIVFENVSFAYANGKNVLEDISFFIKKGSHVGIIGGTGSGKSTLISLITRLYEPNNGTIYLDGEEIKNYTDSSLKKLLSIVPQNIQIISGKIKDAISFGNKIQEEVIHEAAVIACADDFIMNKENGYNSIIEKNGSNFSGGQRQRIAIARAVAQNSEVLIFDDSSSALDNITDNKIKMNIKKRLPGKTIITVSQRVQSIKNSDKIIVIHNSRICGDGTHDELFKNNLIYQEICASQEAQDE